MDRHAKEDLFETVQKLQAQLDNALRLSSQRQRELDSLLQGSKEILAEQGFTQSARAIFDHCKDLIGATSGYVALLNESGEENEVLFLEAGGLPCDVDPELPMPIRGLRATAYKDKKAVYDNDFMNSEWLKFMPKGHVVLNNVMFAPLVLQEKTVGLIGLANKPADFDDNDAKLATGFGELAAIALRKSQDLDKRNQAEVERENIIKDLQEALHEVKTLSGLLPICMHCKKIRDDSGYWNQLEEYIRDRSEAEFTHSICQECMDTYYPEV